MVRKVRGIVTCKVCGLPLGPEEMRKCRVCGRYVCKDHSRYHPYYQGWVCVTCLRKISEGRIRKELALAVALP